MISICMAYRERPEALKATLLRYAEVERDVDMEVVVVDDGSPRNPAQPVVDELGDDLPFRVEVMTLNERDHLLNPCVPLNRATETAKGDLLLITSPEVRPHEATLQRMADICRPNLNRVTVGAVWCTKRGWISHSVEAPYRYHFANMVSTAFWRSMGGFDEEYREGYCFDDPDLVKRLDAASCSWSFIDSPHFDHVMGEDGESKDPKPPKEKWTLNRDLYVSKWGSMPDRY